MKLILIIAAIITGSIVPFHLLSVKTIDNTVLSFEDFKGKYVLVINIASNSPDSSQLGELEELYQHFNGKLAIVVVPGNDFGNEPLTNTEIKSFLQVHYQGNYIITEKQLGMDSLKRSPLFEWLTQKEQNKMSDNVIGNDFYKYLVNRSGQLVAVFSNKVRPMDLNLLNEIQ